MRDEEREIHRLASGIAESALAGSLTIAAAESLTSGGIATALGAAPSSSEWFSGAVVAYMSQTKYDVLGVSPGPVVTEKAALEMAAGVRQLMHADIAVAVTGAGGPDAQDGREPGTVCFGLVTSQTSRSQTKYYTGSPSEVVISTVTEALTLMLQHLPPT